VSITLSFKNGTGGKADKEGGVRTQPFQQENSRYIRSRWYFNYICGRGGLKLRKF